MLPHSDPPTLIILHCVRAAKLGGESQIVNVSSILQGMELARPGLASELFKPMPNWRVEGQDGIPYANPNPTNQPVLARRNGADGALSCYLYRPFLDLACEAKGYVLSTRQKEALDLFQVHPLIIFP